MESALYPIDSNRGGMEHSIGEQVPSVAALVVGVGGLLIGVLGERWHVLTADRIAHIAVISGTTLAVVGSVGCGSI